MNTVFRWIPTLYSVCSELLRTLTIYMFATSRYYVTRGGPPRVYECYTRRGCMCIYMCVCVGNVHIYRILIVFSFVFTAGRDQCAGYNATDRVIIYYYLVCSYYFYYYYYYYYSGCCL